MLAALIGRAAGPAVAEAGARLLSVSGAVREFSSNAFALPNTGRKLGPGGRSSVSGLTATVFGGYGFVGSYVVNELAKRGSQVVVPFRSTDNKVQHIKQMGDLGQIVMLEQFDIRDEAAIKRAISQSNVVINMVGQRMETMNFSYEDVHARWPERLAKIVAASPQVQRLVHFSDLGASEASPSRRMRTKGLGDAAVLDAVPSATILKPGPVVGIEDHFFNYIIYQVTLAPIAPLVDGGVAKVQPTYVHDVASAVVKVLQDRDTAGKTFHLGGPETLTYREVYDTIIKTLRLQTDDTVHVPAWLAKLVFGPKDKARRMLPAVPMANWMYSADYVEEMNAGKTVAKGALSYSDLNIHAAKVTEGLAIEPVRHYRVGGYSWGDMAKVAKDVPEQIRKYYNLK